MNLGHEASLVAIDLFFARCAGGCTEAERALLALLMASARQGHLCMPLSRLDQVTRDETLCSLARLGAETLALENNPFVVREGDLFYLPRNHAFEKRFVEHVLRLKSSMRGGSSSSYASPTSLNPEQKKAVEIALSQPLTCLVGGPGTGKSYTAMHIAAIALAQGLRVGLAAPTGKAAAHLASALQRGGVCSDQVQCGTLHALLGVKRGGDLAFEGAFFPADFVIVDECSMVDAALFSHFLSALETGTGVVLMGDPDQLPAVEAGGLFADLVDQIGAVRLTRCMRSDRADILALATAIREGDASQVLPLAQPLEERLDRLMNDFPSAEAGEPTEMLRRFDGFRLITPLRQGPYGVEEINRQLVASMRQKHRSWVAPILITRTERSLDLYNGETGVLVHSASEEEYALFDKNGECRRISKDALPPYEYAYCLSVHKSQGSEYDHVLLLVPQGSEIFGRQVLYTGATRARQRIEIAGSREVIGATLAKSCRRFSGISI